MPLVDIGGPVDVLRDERRGGRECNRRAVVRQRGGRTKSVADATGCGLGRSLARDAFRVSGFIVIAIDLHGIVGHFAEFGQSQAGVIGRRPCPV